MRSPDALRILLVAVSGWLVGSVACGAIPREWALVAWILALALAITYAVERR